MKITTDTVRYVANLARISLKEDELAHFTMQLDKILFYMEKLSQLDTESVEPTSHVVPLKNVFRSDQVKESLSHEDALKNAPIREGNFFKVPKIIE